MAGWIKVHRKLLDSTMYKMLNSKQRDVLLVCLMKANHSANTWVYDNDKFDLKAGQFITSLPSLVKDTAKDVTVQNIRTALDKLEKWNFLTCKSTNKNRLVTICNWDLYQGDEKETNRQINIEVTGDQQTTNRQVTANKNVKNVKNEKNIDNIVDCPIEIEPQTEVIPIIETEFYMTSKKKKLEGKRLIAFKMFWSAFNYKSGRAGAAQAWLDIPRLDIDILKTIVEAATVEDKGRQAKRDNKLTPIMAQGWLTNRRWEDEQEAESKPKANFNM